MTIDIKKHIQETQWKELANSNNPLVGEKFFRVLENSGSIGKGSGWEPLYFEEKDKSILYTFKKSHSYGEYIFDWDWANGFHQQNIPYYPKLTSMVPFTPATSSHFIGPHSDKLMSTYEEFYRENPFSSSHFLFLSKEELEFFKSHEYTLRDSFQYHFENQNYKCFDDFLSNLKNKKAKQIRKERRFNSDIQISSFSGDQLTKEHAVQMFEFYQRTLLTKQAISYLNLDFFVSAFTELKSNICYVQATRNNTPIAGSLFFYGEDTLYGRYWGSKEDVPNLHFELCYYRGIDFCIDNKIRTFEAGAQGEHKISRGFVPVKTFSAHKIKHSGFQHGINQYIENERIQIDQALVYLNERTPFKKK
jgi:predicted N-acyltransferase